jgi:hypothetical protein
MKGKNLHFVEVAEAKLVFQNIPITLYASYGRVIQFLGTTSQREWEKLPFHGFMVHAWY